MKRFCDRCKRPIIGHGWVSIDGRRLSCADCRDKPTITVPAR